MNENSYELHHLERRQVLFPPNELLIFWPHRRNHIIKVHHNMDKTIDRKINNKNKINKANGL